MLHYYLKLGLQLIRKRKKKLNCTGPIVSIISKKETDTIVNS